MRVCLSGFLDEIHKLPLQFLAIPDPLPPPSCLTYVTCYPNYLTCHPTHLNNYRTLPTYLIYIKSLIWLHSRSILKISTNPSTVCLRGSFHSNILHHLTTSFYCSSISDIINIDSHWIMKLGRLPLKYMWSNDVILWMIEWYEWS